MDDQQEFIHVHIYHLETGSPYNSLKYPYIDLIRP